MGKPENLKTIIIETTALESGMNIKHYLTFKLIHNNDHTIVFRSK